MVQTCKIWRLVEGDSPLVAAAVHDGHAVRPEVQRLTALSDEDRRREEDPFTGQWAEIAANRIVATHSRFQVDLNRPRNRAVYRTPEDAWGLNLWKKKISKDTVAQSLMEYDAFYADAKILFDKLSARFGYFFVFDLHTYNYRRFGPGGPPDDPRENPEVNIGTGTMDRGFWAHVVDPLIAELQAADFLGRRLDVRENIKFKGGHFSRWIHETFPRSGCAVAIEFKKFFMDEWSGALDERQHQAIHQALQRTVPVVLDALLDLQKG
ncbi:MAG: N-formylglutamate amidohydrolase [Candidatus Latescibacterota bacterium]